MPNNRYRGPPMTLANMRAQGVRSLWVVCELCHHEGGVECGRLWRCRAGARLRPAHGLHPLRNHWRARAAELGGTPAAREPDRAAMAVGSKKDEGRDERQGRAIPKDPKGQGRDEA